MKVKFKENTTGEIYEFDEWDAEGMRRHPEYTEVKEEPKKPELKAPAKTLKS
jgi:hypothetical protein